MVYIVTYLGKKIAMQVLFQKMFNQIVYSFKS